MIISDALRKRLVKMMKKSISFSFGSSPNGEDKFEVIGYDNGKFIAFAVFQKPIRLPTKKIKTRCGHHAYVIGNIRSLIRCPRDSNRKIGKIRAGFFRESPQNAKRITIENLADRLNGRLLFYTGAGISAAAGIPLLSVITDSFGISRTTLIDDFSRDLSNGENGKLRIKQKFDKLLIKAKPTKAHKSLEKIRRMLKAELATENIDFLHEGVGSNILRRSDLSKLNVKDLKRYDLIVTIGLAKDESFIIRKWKRLGGRIAAIDLKPPEYLGKGDFYVLGDCQKLLPRLEQLLSSQNK